jgi:hypothetical protein
MDDLGKLHGGYLIWMISWKNITRGEKDVCVCVCVCVCKRKWTVSSQGELFNFTFEDNMNDW